MVTYTESTGNTTTYNQSNPTESVWDSGVSSWDVSGNTELTLWDVTLQSYIESSSNTVIWTEQ